MADSPAPFKAGDDTGEQPDAEATAGTPRWVKVFGIVALVVVVLVVLMLLIGGDHGPGRHTAGSQTALYGGPDAASHASPAGNRAAG